MLFKHKNKVYVEIDERGLPLVGENGLVHYRYEMRQDAAEYRTTREMLTLILGVEVCEKPVGEKKDAKPRRKMITSVALPPYPDDVPQNTIVVYTDGGASPNPGPAGAAFLMMYGGHSLEVWEYLEHATNNVAELTAVLRALEHVKNKKIPVLLYSDSGYVLGLLNETMKLTKNRDLIEKIQVLRKQFAHLEALKVKAHVGVACNEHVDKLVTLARDTQKSGSRRDGVST